MRSRICSSWVLGLVLSVLPLAGCLQESSISSQAVAAAEVASPPETPAVQLAETSAEIDPEEMMAEADVQNRLMAADPLITVHGSTIVVELNGTRILDTDLSKVTEYMGGKAHPGKVVATEPVAGYLIELSGLADVTPPAFAKAVQEENDPPAAAVAATRDLITGKQVTALVDNVQTETSVTDALTKAAHDAGVPVVGVSETMPNGVAGYVDWMNRQIDSLSKAAGG